MARLTITDSAIADLQEIYYYIAQDKVEAARKFIERLRLKARLLAKNPRIGRNRTVDLRPDLYSFPVGKYILFYTLQTGGIVLIRVLHGSRDLQAIFENIEL
jgi:toxin ParE1/3/4